MKFAKYYVVATQGLLTIVILLLIGYFIGVGIDANSVWPGVLSALGAICGLVSFIITLLRLLKQEDKTNATKNGSKN